MKAINILIIVTSVCVLEIAIGCKKKSEIPSPPLPPVVTTNAVTNVSYTSAFSGGPMFVQV